MAWFLGIIEYIMSQGKNMHCVLKRHPILKPALVERPRPGSLSTRRRGNFGRFDFELKFIFPG